MACASTETSPNLSALQAEIHSSRKTKNGKHRTWNFEGRTLNETRAHEAQPWGVGCSMFDVRCFQQPFFISVLRLREFHVLWQVQPRLVQLAEQFRDELRRVHAVEARLIIQNQTMV